MLNHALLNDQIGFCTWSVLTTALTMLALETALSLSTTRQSISQSFCFCPFKPSSPKLHPLLLPESYEKHRQLHFMLSCLWTFLLSTCMSQTDFQISAVVRLCFSSLEASCYSMSREMTGVCVSDLCPLFLCYYDS